MSYIGCSPVGLIGTEDMIEIKFPYSIKHLDAVYAAKYNKLSYKSRNGDLNKSHHYFYQIRGMLEIFDRLWCDLIIYSKSNVFVKRIIREKAVWTYMCPKLKYFYLTICFQNLFTLLMTNN